MMTAGILWVSEVHDETTETANKRISRMAASSPTRLLVTEAENTKKRFIC
jgi:hypothetical protein